MKRTRVLGGLLAASAALIAAVVFCFPASARQTRVPEVIPPLPVIPAPSVSVPSDLPPVLDVTRPVPPIQQTYAPHPAPTWNGGTATAATFTEPPPVSPKDATVDELIARLAELKAKEAELTEILRTKLLMQQRGLEKLKKLGVAIEDENTAPMQRVPPSAVPSPVGPSAY